MRGISAIVECEESQATTIELRALGVEAYSRDILPCSGGHPEWHKQEDAIQGLGEYTDLRICHPPCTILTNSGVRWLVRGGVRINPERWDELEEAIIFFNKFKRANSLGIGIENPVPHKYARDGFVNRHGRRVEGIGMYTQTIQPWQFGHLETKRTALWLINLPKLIPTKNVYAEMMELDYADRAKVHYASPGPDRAKIRSKTYSGIAKAMADQWSNYILAAKGKEGV